MASSTVQLTLRPVLDDCGSASGQHDSKPLAPSDSGWLPEAVTGGSQCSVGPAMADELVFSNNAVMEEADGGWLITVDLRPGAAGEDRFNALASECFMRSQVCPTGRMAIVLGNRIVAAPTVQTATFPGYVQLRVTTRSDADSIVDLVNGGTS